MPRHINRDFGEVGRVVQRRQEARPPFSREVDIPYRAVAEQHPRRLPLRALPAVDAVRLELTRAAAQGLVL